MANPRKSGRLKALHGTARADRAPEPVEFVASAPEPPEWLAGEARAEWDRIVPELEAVNLLTQIDRGVLTVWCETWATYVKAYRDIQDNGLTFETNSGYQQQRPSVGIMTNARKDLRLMAPSLGMTSEGRKKQDPVVPAEKPHNKWQVVG